MSSSLTDLPNTGGHANNGSATEVFCCRSAGSIFSNPSLTDSQTSSSFTSSLTLMSSFLNVI